MTATIRNPLQRFRPGLGDDGTVAQQVAEGIRNQAWPWVEAPPNSQPFNKIGSIATPAAGAAETVVLSWTVPPGYDGAIFGVMNIYTNPSFIEGSGNLIWRIRLAGRPAFDYGNIITTLGSVQEMAVVYGGLLVKSQQQVTYSIVHAAGSPLPPGPGTRIVCGTKGYFWPITGGPMAG